MAWKKSDASEIHYEIKPDGIDEVIDEAPGSNSFIALREVKWSADKEDYKLDLRKYFCRADGTEQPGKGVSFTTEEGPNTLVEVMIKHGYGHTDKILSALAERGEDMAEVVANCTSEVSDSFIKDLKTAYKKIQENKPKNARDMLNQIL